MCSGHLFDGSIPNDHDTSRWDQDSYAASAITFSADMKVSQQCRIAASKGNQILGLIRRTITYKGNS